MGNTDTTRALGYIQGLLLRIGRANCTNLARCVGGSHDRLTKLLNTTSIVWSTVVIGVMSRLFGTMEGGYLIIDETTIDKSYAKVIEGCRWIWSNKDNQYVFGYHVTLLLWRNDVITIPLALRVYQKAATKEEQVTAIDLALDLLEYARNTLKIQPDYVLMDGFYSADKILKRLHEWNWLYVMRVKNNRLLNETQIKKLHKNPYWEETGVLSCKLTVRIVRDEKRYFITNDMNGSRQDVVDLYGKRWKIEEVFRVLHSELGLDQCESRSSDAQLAHFYLTLITFALLESEQTRTEYLTHYAIIREVRLQPRLLDNGFVGERLGWA